MALRWPQHWHCHQQQYIIMFMENSSPYPYWGTKKKYFISWMQSLQQIFKMQKNYKNKLFSPPTCRPIGSPVCGAHCPLLLTPHLQLPGPRLTYHQHWHWLVSTRKHCQHMTTWHKAQLKRGTQSNLGAKIHKLPWMWDAGLWSLSHYRVKHFVTCWIYVTLVPSSSQLSPLRRQQPGAALGIIILVHWANWESFQLTIIESSQRRCCVCLWWCSCLHCWGHQRQAAWAGQNLFPISDLSWTKAPTHSNTASNWHRVLSPDMSHFYMAPDCQNIINPS